MDEQTILPEPIEPFEQGWPDNGRTLQPAQSSPLEIAGQIANRVAGQNIFQRYLRDKAANTIKRLLRPRDVRSTGGVPGHCS